MVNWGRQGVIFLAACGFAAFQLYRFQRSDPPVNKWEAIEQYFTHYLDMFKYDMYHSTNLRKEERLFVVTKTHPPEIVAEVVPLPPRVVKRNLEQVQPRGRSKRTGKGKKGKSPDLTVPQFAMEAYNDELQRVKSQLVSARLIHDGGASSSTPSPQRKKPTVERTKTMEDIREKHTPEEGRNGVPEELISEEEETFVDDAPAEGVDAETADKIKYEANEDWLDEFADELASEPRRPASDEIHDALRDADDIQDENAAGHRPHPVGEGPEVQEAEESITKLSQKVAPDGEITEEDVAYDNQRP